MLLVIVNSGEEQSFIWNPERGQEIVAQLSFQVKEISVFQYTLKKYGGLVIYMQTGQ